ncbi:GMC family oxidoreductase [Nocardia vinacea]|uniref:GMC family oxidoreductase n=1 Tax=Nocardia vinacea TaxID=96468 RepID=UPI0002D69A48|nr:GMC family oxidoreductase N-terminal domain-containing protein [Nocardia vinacea]
MARRIVVVGGGSGGCVMAARLSEDENNDVVLVEAGPDYPSLDDLHEHVRDAFTFGFTSHDWGYVSEDHIPGSANAPTFAIVEQGVLPVLRGKVMGGSSSVNATNALRPTPRDFEQWVGLGLDKWSWDEVLPYLKRLERDPVGGPLHGTDGPVPIKRWSEGDGLRPFMAAFVESAASLGYRVVDDLNGESQLGVGPVPMNQQDGVRQSTAVTYLAAARGRKNLTVRGGADVDRLEIVDGRPRAVVLADGERIDADLVVLCAGSIGTPSILMRSGIGPAEVLEQLDIPVEVPLEGVGRNLRDHPLVYMTYTGDAEAIGELLPPLQVVLTTSAAGPGGSAEIDLHMIPFTLEPGSILVAVGLVRPYSIGSTEIRSADPGTDPRILLNLLHHPDDLRRLVRGIELTRQVMKSGPLAKYVGEELWPGPSAVTTGQLTQAVLEAKNTYAHAVGTAAMGEAGSPWAVVGQDCKVHGLDALYIADASVMPTIVGVPTNTTTMMIAERCADFIKDIFR